MSNNFYTRAEQLQEQEWSDRDEKKNASMEPDRRTIYEGLSSQEYDVICSMRESDAHAEAIHTFAVN